MNEIYKTLKDHQGGPISNTNKEKISTIDEEFGIRIGDKFGIKFGINDTLSLCQLSIVIKEFLVFFLNGRVNCG